VFNDAVLEQLLERCARDDHAAFADLYKQTSAKLFAICRHMLRDPDLAEETLQESFTQIWRDASNFNRHRATATTWLAVIVRHRCLDQLRQRKREFVPDSETIFAAQEDTGPGPLETALSWSDQQALKQCFEVLSDEQRNSISLAFMQGLSHQQLSEKLTIPVGTIKSWIRRGMERLKRCLQQ